MDRGFLLMFTSGCICLGQGLEEPINHSDELHPSALYCIDGSIPRAVREFPLQNTCLRYCWCICFIGSIDDGGSSENAYNIDKGDLAS